MNADRRKRIATLIQALTPLRDDLDQIASEERDAFDNMPDSLKDGDRGQKSSAAADLLDEVKDALTEAIDNLEGMES